MFLFVFSLVVGNYYYGEMNIEFIKISKIWFNIYCVFVIVMVVYGCLVDFQIVWDMVNLFMGFLVFINLVVILLLSNVVYKIYKDYVVQCKKGFDFVFKVENVLELKYIEIWVEEEGISFECKIVN